jgi:hypothetical protein
MCTRIRTACINKTLKHSKMQKYKHKQLRCNFLLITTYCDANKAKDPASKTGVSFYLSTCNTENGIAVTNKS